MKLLVFIGRYAHQPIVTLLDMPMPMLMVMAEQTAELIKEEGDAMAEAAATGGGG